MKYDKPKKTQVVSIPRAEYQGTWADFCKDNEAFFPYGELDRIGHILANGHAAQHNAHTAGRFDFYPCALYA